MFLRNVTFRSAVTLHCTEDPFSGLQSNDLAEVKLSNLSKKWRRNEIKRVTTQKVITSCFEAENPGYKPPGLHNLPKFNG